MLSSWNDHNLISLVFCSGYYKAAALTTDKLLQEHQEVNVSSVCLHHPLMAGIPNGYQPLIGTPLVRNCWRRGGLIVSGTKRSGFEPWPGTLCGVLGQDTLLSQCLSPPRCINGYRQT